MATCYITCNTTTSCTSTSYPMWHNTITTSSCLTTTNCTTLDVFPGWHIYVVEELTEEQAAALAAHNEAADAQREQMRRAQAEAEEKRKLASARARELMLAHLTAEQRATMEKHHWFVVEGGKSSKRYRIFAAAGVAGNVYEMDGDMVVARYCCHLANAYPNPDHYLAQKLMLEWDETEFLRLANRTAA